MEGGGLVLRDEAAVIFTPSRVRCVMRLSCDRGRCD